MRLEQSKFERLVEEAIRSLPTKFKKKLENVVIIVEEKPSKSQLREMKIRPYETLFGLYEGVPYPSRDSGYGNVLPDRIIIFKSPIEMSAHNEKEIRETIRDTVIHEVAHFFGMSDEEIETILD